MPTQIAVKSPCVGVCEADARTDLCRGCLRTVEEISQWRDSSDDERREILRRVERRRNGHRNGVSG
jgi:hypothetical protein